MTTQSTQGCRLLTALLLLALTCQVWCSLKCPPQCTDGCHGTSNGKCIPCKNFSLGTSCVDSCPNNYYVEKKHHVTVTTVSPGIVSTHQNVASQPHHHDVPILPSVMVETKSMSHTENTDRNPYKSTQRPDLQTLNNNSLRDNAVYQSDVDLPASNVTIGGETAGQSGNSTTQPANQPEDNYHDQPDLLSFENICQPCHKECDCCHGPLSSDCRSCRHKKHRNDCISKCPSWTLEFNNSCYECRNECYRKCRGVDPRDCKYCKAVFNDTCMEICPTDCDPAACQIIGSAGEKSRQRHKDSILLPILIAIATGLLIFMLILVIICNCNRHGLSGNYIIPSDIQVPFQSFENVQTPDLLRKDLPDLETEEKDDKDETKKSEDHDEILNIKDETEKSEDLMKKRPEQDGVMECDGGPECNIGPETEHEPEYNAGSDIRQQTIDVPDGFGEMLLAKQEADDHSQRLPMKCLDSTEDSKCLDHKDASYPLLQLKHADVPLRSEATDASIFLVHDVKEFDSATSSLTKNGTTAVSPNQIYLDVSKHALSVNNDMKAAVSENDSDIGSLYSFVSGSEADSGLGSPLAARHKSEGISSVQHGSLYKSDSTTIQIGNISVDIGKNTDSMSTLADSACDLSFKQEFGNSICNQACNFIAGQKQNDKRKFNSLPKFRSTTPRRPRVLSLNTPIKEFPFITSNPRLESRPLLKAGDKDEGASASVLLHAEKPVKMENQTRKRIQELLFKFKDLLAKNGTSYYYSNDVFAAAVIGKTGGNLSITAMDVHLFIPPGSVDHDVSIYIYVEESLHGNVQLENGKTVLTPTVYCGPCGMKFIRPVVLTTPHCAARLSGWNADVYNTDSEGDDDARWKLVPQNEMMRVIKKTDMTMFPIHFTGFKGGAAEDKWMKIFIIGKELKRGDFMYPFEVKMCNKLESDIKSILDKAAESGCKELKSDEIMICDIKNEGITMLVDQLQDGWNVRGHSSKIIPYQYIWSSEHFGSVTKVPCCSFQLDLVDRSSPEASCLVSGDVHTFQESKRELDVVLHLHSEIQQREEEAYQRHDVSTSLRRSSDTTPIPSGACCSSDTPSTRFLSRQDELKPTAMMKQFLTDHISREVCVLLDELKGDGTDWRSLAQELGVNDLITHLKQKQDIGESPSRYLLDFYFAEQCKVQPPLKDEDVVTKLISLLYKLNKGQAANVLEEFSAKHICKPI